MIIYEIVWFYKIVMFFLIIFFVRDFVNECFEWDGCGLYRYRERRFFLVFSLGGCG